MTESEHKKYSGASIASRAPLQLQVSLTGPLSKTVEGLGTIQ